MFKNHVIGAKDEFISCDYKTRNSEYPTHNGIDLVSSSGKDLSIIAIADGKILSVVDGISGYSETNTCGNYVKILQNDGYITRYLHMTEHSICVKQGQTVKKGDKLGLMGNTGYSFGKHLHFDVFNGSEYVDPLPYLNGTKTFDKNVSDLKVGDSVVVNKGSSWSDGTKPFDFVYDTTYTVQNVSINGLECLIGIDGVATGWIFCKDVTKIDSKKVRIGDKVTINGEIWGKVTEINTKGDTIKAVKND